MRQTAIALYSYWNSFDIPAYPENNVPDDVQLPYITYELARSDWKGQSLTHVRVWYRDTSYVPITNKVNEIAESIGEGKILPTSSGFVALFKDTNFCQFQPTGDVDLKIAYLSFVMETNTY